MTIEILLDYRQGKLLLGLAGQRDSLSIVIDMQRQAQNVPFEVTQLRNRYVAIYN